MAEYSLVRIRKGRLEELIEQGDTGASLVLRMVGSLDAYLNVAQLGNTVASLVLGWFGGRLLVEVLGEYFPLIMQDMWMISILTVVCAFAILLCLQVVFGEFMPRILALGKVEKVSLFVARPLYLFYIVTYPLSVVFSRISKALLQLFGVDPVPDADITHSEDELRMIVSASERGGVLDHVESRLIDNVFDFADRVAREVMVPRQDMVCLFTDDTLAENFKVTRQTGHTRYPLCTDDRDHIIGMIHIRDLMDVSESDGHFDLRTVMRPIEVVPESMSIAKILQIMQKKHIQMAAVADEYGGTAGLVTMEDLLEEIVGDIQDEHDTDMPEISRSADGSYVFDGLVLLDEVSEIFNIKFDEPEEDTIGGFVFGLLGRQPENGDKVMVDGYTFEVLDSTGFRVLRVKVKPPLQAGEEEKNNE
jgi:CBS domain containing-hemolysin-like protein